MRMKSSFFISFYICIFVFMMDLTEFLKFVDLLHDCLYSVLMMLYILRSVMP